MEFSNFQSPSHWSAKYFTCRNLNFNVAPQTFQRCTAPCHKWAGFDWTVLQSRQYNNNGASFNKSYSDYEDGFGDPTTGYWMGLKCLHLMTLGRSHSLMIELMDDDGEMMRATYSKFKVGGPETGYRLTLDGLVY